MPNNTFAGIIDVYHQNGLNLANARKAGVTAILHKASEGAASKDAKYASRKAAAMGDGFLWGAYHLTSGADPKKQLDNFLSVEDGSDPKVQLALDWETAQDGTILNIDGIRELIRLFHGKLSRYPMLYGGWTLRDTPEVVMGDPLLAKCPLWYQRYNWEPKALPVRTWPTYTLWQFASEERGYGAPPSNIMPGADYNRFQGTEAELAAAWPFVDTSKLVPKQPTVLPRKYMVTATSLNIRKGPAIDKPIVGSLKEGKVITALGFSEDKQWVEVNESAGKGYCALRWLRLQVEGGSTGEPAWMPVARAEIGVREVPGSGDNPRIVEYLQSTTLGSPENRNDETFWCSAFTNWCMEEAGIEGTNSAWARDWLNWGTKASEPKDGCVVVFSRGSGGHVGFFVEARDGQIFVLGGNQSDAVSIAGHDASRLLGFRVQA
jgi:uncharacterized protein (TIGR02594 family)